MKSILNGLIVLLWIISALLMVILYVSIITLPLLLASNLSNLYWLLIYVPFLLYVIGEFS